MLFFPRLEHKKWKFYKVGETRLGSWRYHKLLKRSWSIKVAQMVIPPTDKEEKVLPLAMETVPNFNSFISHLMGCKAQPLETHKGEKQSVF